MGRIPAMLKGVLAGILLLVPAAGAAPALENRLADHPSPYLAMHADDPVHWQTWNRETLERARRLQRPLLVSIGYFSCHWCHVMQRESYRDPLLAKLLNDYFIPVKVDRELNPDLDAHLIEFVQLTRGNAGWPLNVFLTPEGYPLVGMTYVPREQFFAVLDNLRRSWQEDPGRLRQMAREGMEEWRRIRRQEDGPPATADVGRAMLEQSARIRDELAGGFGQQNKFPLVSQLQALLWLRQHRGERSQDEFIRLTLDRMASQGLHDEIGGGFFRYVIDPDWHTPHYEKMLYDNARLAVLYLQAAQVYDSADYRRTGLETLDFMLRDMWREAGYFIASFSAVDAQGREGYYYLWDDATLQEVLDADELKAVRAAWFDTRAPDSEYGRLPRWQGRLTGIAARLGLSPARLQQLLSQAREKLRKARAGRELPADDKGLAAWNGLALSALAAGYAATGGRHYGREAGLLARYLSRVLWDGNSLQRARDGGRSMAPGTLEDYALVARGLWDWARQQPDDNEYDKLAARLLREAWRRYYRDDRWVLSDTPLIPGLGGRVALEDSALPSATAVVARLSGLHPALLGDATVRSRRQAHLAAVRARLADDIFWYAGYVALLEPDQLRE